MPTRIDPAPGLDAQTISMLDRLYADPFLDPERMTPPQMRAAFDAFYAKVGLPPCEAEARDAEIPAPGRPVRLRIYRPPEAAGRLPIVVFYLGGGLVMGSLDSYDGLCRRLCKASGAVVISTSYRQPPEYPFPAAADDSYAALVWAHRHAEALGGDPDRLVVAGESGGGMLAAVVSQMALDRGGPPIAFQLLIYPAVGRSPGSRSMVDFAQGYWFEPGQLDWLYGIYAQGHDPNDPRISPLLRENFRGLPPAHITVAEYDILRDDILAYAAKLEAAGSSVEVVSYPTIHGFTCMGGVIDMAAEALDVGGQAIGRALARC
jgi:acetyl esterase